MNYKYMVDPQREIRRILPFASCIVSLSLIIPCPHDQVNIWLCLDSPQLKAFCWFAVANKVSTVDHLKRKGIIIDAISNTYFFRLGERNNHLFIYYPISSHIWISIAYFSVS